MFRSIPSSRPQSLGIDPEPAPKVFLSYAAEDSQLALRVYDDLARSGIRVWRYEKALRLQPLNIQYWAQLALLYHCERAPRQKAEVINRALQLQPETIEDEYFYGLVYFLNNDEKRANEYYEASKSLSWPPYARLIL